MKTKTAKELTLEWHERVWNNLEEAAIHELMCTRCDIAGLDLSSPGPEGFLKLYHQFLSVFEAIHIDVFEMAEEDGHVVGHARFTATHKATNRKVDFPFSLSVKWKDGKATEARNVVDYTTLLSQLDMLDMNTLAQALSPQSKSEAMSQS